MASISSPVTNTNTNNITDTNTQTQQQQQLLASLFTPQWFPHVRWVRAYTCVPVVCWRPWCWWWGGYY
ncbi:MAG: hypothetical protein QW350_05795 [Candidatus Aenigmatarchaeota archaeon]